MDSSANKAILYDESCPMCALYTRGFVKWGVLEPANRVAFSQLDEKLSPDSIGLQIDLNRARHEIPLVDLAGGPTLYGVDAMLFLLKQRLPLFGYVSRNRYVYALAKFLYSLVSYNRRIIIPSQQVQMHNYDCTPNFHKGYRQAFIIYAICLASSVTYLFGLSVANYWPVSDAGGRMLLICGSGWVLQMMSAALFLKGQQRIDYWGHLAVLMILGVLVLLPGMTLSALTSYQFPWIPALSVLVSSALMTWQHVRRVTHLGLSQRWTLLWFLSLQMTAAGWLFAFFYTF